MKKILTLCMIHTDRKILLGMKKRGFGVGKWNGFGGKIEEGESLEETAMREVQEECGLMVHLTLENIVGVHNFYMQADDEHLEVHVFSVDTFEGSLIESEEMKPQWFDIGDIPYEDMWEDDKDWLPLMLRGGKFKGEYTFGTEGNILKSSLIELD